MSTHDNIFECPSPNITSEWKSPSLFIEKCDYKSALDNNLFITIYNLSICNKKAKEMTEIILYTL